MKSTPEPEPPDSTEPAAVRDHVEAARTIADRLAADKEGCASEDLSKAVVELAAHLARASEMLAPSRLERLFQEWAALIYLLAITSMEVFFIELYCRWHGAKFLSLDLYRPENVAILAKIDFVEGATPMSVTAEVLMWSSLGIWAARSFSMIRRYSDRRARPARDITEYAGILIRNTSLAAIVVTLLTLSKVSIFGQSIENFPATAGLSFILGFFGDDTFKLFNRMRKKALGALFKDSDE